VRNRDYYWSCHGRSRSLQIALLSRSRPSTDRGPAVRYSGRNAEERRSCCQRAPRTHMNVVPVVLKTKSIVNGQTNINILHAQALKIGFEILKKLRAAGASQRSSRPRSCRRRGNPSLILPRRPTVSASCVPLVRYSRRHRWYSLGSMETQKIIFSHHRR
jgi:hypothetical protein